MCTLHIVYCKHCTSTGIILMQATLALLAPNLACQDFHGPAALSKTSAQNQIHTNPHKSIQIQTNPCKSIQIHTNSYKSMEIHTNPYKFTQIHANPYKSWVARTSMARLPCLTIAQNQIHIARQSNRHLLSQNIGDERLINL